MTAQGRIARELETVRVMIGMFCADKHGGKGVLCADCGELWRYTQERVERCRFKDDKPTCLNCTVHCFKPDMREKVRTLMRHAGPRMMWRHPVLALLHLWDGRRKTREASG